MTVPVVVVIAALVFAGIGLFVEAAGWALLVALALLIVGAATGAATLRGSGRRGSAVPPLV